MKKIIAISVMFVLLTGAAFAVDLGGTVIGNVDVLQSSTADGAKVESGAGLGRVRIDGGGGTEDGVFGGYFRFDGAHWSGNHMAFGNAWWKPIDQFKLLIGSNGGDGFIGKEGVTGWMFYQTPCDTDVSMGGNNSWGGSFYGFGIQTRDAFFEGGGDGGDNVYLFITPADIVSINVILPFFNGGETADVFKKAVAQLDIHLDFGNIAVTYVGGLGYKAGVAVPGEDEDDEPTIEGGYDDPASIFAYFGGNFGPLALDVGLGYKFASADGKVANPIGVGLGLKYGADAFGVKFRVVAKLAGDDKATKVLADVLPYFNLSDKLAAFVSVGLGVNMPDGADTVVGWHFNPYVQVGEEWGAKFLAGIKAWSSGGKDSVVNWAVPIALIVSF